MKMHAGWDEWHRIHNGGDVRGRYGQWYSSEILDAIFLHACRAYGYRCCPPPQNRILGCRFCVLMVRICTGGHS